MQWLNMNRTISVSPCAQLSILHLPLSITFTWETGRDSVCCQEQVYGGHRYYFLPSDTRGFTFHSNTSLAIFSLWPYFVTSPSLLVISTNTLSSLLEDTELMPPGYNDWQVNRKRGLTFWEGPPAVSNLVSGIYPGLETEKPTGRFTCTLSLAPTLE